MVALDTPLLRVSRPVAACSRCRSAKVKCDGKLPACSACERAGKAEECSSTNDEFAKGKERNYVATLEMKVEKLESKIKAIREEKERRKSSSVVAELDAFSQSRRPSETQQLVQRGGRAALRKEASNIDELVSDFGLLAVNSTARDFYGFTSSISYTGLILSASRVEPLPPNVKKDIPPRYTARALIQHFLTNIFPLYPMFEETMLYSAIDAVYHTEPWKASPFDFWSVRMVLAIACASRSVEYGDTEYQDAVGYVAAALEDAESVLRPGSVVGVQAMLLLVLYSTLDTRHFDSWTLLGAASRALVDVGLHQNVSKGTTMSKAKYHTRKRVFWCLYALDRATSLAQSKAFSFSDDSCSIGSVKPVDAEKLVALNMDRRQSQDETSSSADQTPAPVLFMQPITPGIALFELRKLQSKFYTDLFQSSEPLLNPQVSSPLIQPPRQEAWADRYQYIWSTLRSLRSWWNELPPSIPQNLKDFLELEMLYSSVYVLGPSPRIPQISDFAQTLIFEYATSYAAKLYRLLYSTIKGDSVRAAPICSIDAMKAYMTGRQLLDVIRINENAVLFSNLHEAAPAGTQNIGPAPLPPTPHSVHDGFSPGREPAGPPNISRAISCVSMYDDILGWLGVRWGSINWQQRFQRDAQPVLNRLQSWTGSPYQGPLTPNTAKSTSPFNMPVYTNSHSPHFQPNAMR
ncbi:MAG: hypothetical protein M1820_000557 [Bogoriella megaspora]|nr:MAG: hypothetical protein M1820_000557 [Bogoriella megaspora]